MPASLAPLPGKRAGAGATSPTSQPSPKKAKDEGAAMLALGDVVMGDPAATPTSGDHPQPSSSGDTGGKAGKGRGKGKKGRGQAVSTLAPTDTARLLHLLARMNLNQAQTLRDLTGALFDTVIVRTDLPFVARMEEQGSTYAATVKQRPEIGPPHVWIFGSMVEGLVAVGPEIGKKNSEELTAFLGEYSDLDPVGKHDMVKYCRRVVTWDKTLTRLVLCISCPVRRAILDSLTQLGGIRKVGRAPASGQERDLQSWLARLTAD